MTEEVKGTTNKQDQSDDFDLINKICGDKVEIPVATINTIVELASHCSESAINLLKIKFCETISGDRRLELLGINTNCLYISGILKHFIE